MLWSINIQDRNIKWPMLFNIKLAQVDIVCYDIQQKTSEQLLLIPATATTEQEGSWLMDFVVFNSIVHDWNKAIFNFTLFRVSEAWI